MHGFVSFNQRLIPTEAASIPAFSAAAFYGKGVFTTIQIGGGIILLWKKHWWRVTANAAKLRIDISNFSESSALSTFSELILKNNVMNGRVRLTFFDESASGIWLFDTGRKASLLITTADNRKISENFQLTVSPHRINTTSPLAGIKSCNYLKQSMAFEEAKARGFDEAIRLNEHGEIASACMANVFWLKDGAVFTPSLQTGCLPGTTREFILESIVCSEVEASIDELIAADDIFLTSAGIGVVQAAKFEGGLMKQQPHSILEIVPKPI